MTSTPTPAPGNPSHLLFDLASKLDYARAVAMCLSESSDIHGVAPHHRAQLDHLGYLCGALEELLALAITACQTLEPHVKGA